MATYDLSTTGPELSSAIRAQRRAPAPMLSPQQIALARSLPHSRTSTPTPSLLTPPVSGTLRSPPPRLEADDYMNVHGPDHHHHKRKHSRKRIRKLYNTRDESEGSKLPQRSPRSGPQTATSNGSECELCARDISDGDEDSGSNAPLIKSLLQPSPQTHLLETLKDTESNGVHVQTSPTLSSSVVPNDEPESPAVNALRSLSFQTPVRSNSQGLQRVSTALANTLNLFAPKPKVSFAAVPSHTARKKAEEASRRSSAHSKSLVYLDINRRHPTIKDGKDDSRMLGTPASITLRKASNVYAASSSGTSMSASLPREREYMRAADSPASELLAFYSSPTLKMRPSPTNLPSPESAEAPKSLMEQPTITFEVEPQAFWGGSKSVSQFSAITNARRCSMPAEAALTYAEVHVAPGSFAVGPKSRKQSLVAAEFTRRISTVQFRSHNSVHEVIWREDESTSGSSLTASSGASQDAGHSFRSTPSSQSEGSPMREPAVRPKGAKALLPKVPESVSKLTRMPETLFRWTWGTSSSVDDTHNALDHKSDPLGQRAETTAQVADTTSGFLSQVLVMNTSDPGSANLQQSSNQQDPRSQKPSFSKPPSVQFFPPLRPRRSTAEWQNEPLVDLDDPLAGRVTQDKVQESDHSTRPGAGVGGNISGNEKRRPSQLHDAAGGRRWSSSPPDNARFGSVGSIGSCIGAHSHKRIVSRRKV